MDYKEQILSCAELYPFREWRERADDGLEQYSEANCQSVQGVFDRLLARLVDLGPGAEEPEILAYFRESVLALNRIEEENEGLIETDEREELCELVDTIATRAGLDPSSYGRGEGVASEWREW